MENTIWALFSIENEYNQPLNNLEGWWLNKPNFIQLANFFNIIIDIKKGDAFIGQLLKGREIRYQDAYYRLIEIKEGEKQ